MESTAAGILLPLQFLPVMRRKFMGLHRWAGRGLFVLLMIGNISMDFPSLNSLLYLKSIRALS